MDITPAYENFAPDDDYPAVMFNNAIVDMHHDVNVCGVVYGPSFVEFESTDSSKKDQYINGAIYGGGGIYVRSSDNPVAKQAIRYDPNTVDKLQTMNGKGQVLMRTGFAILK